MKKKIKLLLMLGLIFICGCTKNQNDTKTQEIMSKIGLVSNHLKENFVTNVKLIEKKDLDFSTAQYVKEAYGVDFIGHIYCKMFGTDFILVAEYENEQDSQKAYNNYWFSFDGLYKVVNNLVIVDMFPLDMLLEEYVKDKGTGFILSKSGNKLLYSTKDADITIPTQVEELAGFSCKYAKTVTFNNNIKRIGPVAFLSLDMEKLILPEGLQHIGKTAFAACTNLKNVVIPSTVSSIEPHAFKFGNIFCNVKSKPIDWHENFISGDAKVYWLGEWEYDEQGNPKPINTNTNNNDSVEI